MSIGSGKAVGGAGGAVYVTVGSGNTGAGGELVLSAGTAAAATGGEVTTLVFVLCRLIWS